MFGFSVFIHSISLGRPPTTYEERYESLEQLNEWMKEQPIEMYELERHDRLCQMFAGRGVLLQFGGVFWVGWIFGFYILKKMGSNLCLI